MQNHMKSCMPLVVVGLMGLQQPAFARANAGSEAKPTASCNFVSSTQTPAPSDATAGATTTSTVAADDDASDNEEEAEGSQAEGEQLASNALGLSAEDLFSTFSYDENKAPDARYIGKWPAQVEMFAKMMLDPKDYLDNVAASTLPLLIAGPKGSGKTSLVHTLAADVQARLIEIEIGSEAGEVAQGKELQGHAVLVLSAIESAKKELVKNPDLKIMVHLKSYDAQLPLRNLLDGGNSDKTRERLFLVASLEVDPAKQDVKAIVEENSAFFKSTLTHADSATKRVLLSRALAKRNHAIDHDELDELSDSLEKVNPKQFDLLLDLAYREALCRSLSPKAPITKKHIMVALKNSAFEPAIALSYYN